MFEFTKICNEYEKMSTIERGVLLAGKSVTVLTKLKLLDIDGIDPVETLAAYIIGSVTADGVVNEQEYILIYPALVRVFGDDFDFATIKKAFKNDTDGKNAVKKYTKDLTAVFGCIDEDLKADIVSLCLCVVTVDGKISLKERRYIRSLINA